MNLKNLRIFDIRVNTRSHSNTRPTKSNFTRYTSGVCVDPHMDYRVASYFDDIVVIWDTRNFDKPIWTKTQSTEIVQLAWSPTRSGLLCSLVKGMYVLCNKDVSKFELKDPILGFCFTPLAY